MAAFGSSSPENLKQIQQRRWMKSNHRSFASISFNNICRYSLLSSWLSSWHRLFSARVTIKGPIWSYLHYKQSGKFRDASLRRMSFPEKLTQGLRPFFFMLMAAEQSRAIQLRQLVSPGDQSSLRHFFVWIIELPGTRELALGHSDYFRVQVVWLMPWAGVWLRHTSLQMEPWQVECSFITYDVVQPLVRLCDGAAVL